MPRLWLLLGLLAFTCASFNADRGLWMAAAIWALVGLLYIARGISAELDRRRRARDRVRREIESIRGFGP